MKRLDLIALLFVFLVIIVLQLSYDYYYYSLSDKQTEEIIRETAVYNEPYIRYATDCCLDQDSDKICDEDQNSSIITKEDAKEEKVG